MKGIEISGENLEDLLAYDDLFLDYFNAFLQLPTFPQPLKYDRLTGTFREVPGSNFSVSGSGSESPPYGATDDERERQLEWAKTERLPLFLRTRLFREMKLCKLLLRPLEDRYSAGGGSSRQLRGYSRQTESYVSSLSNSADNSANEDADYDDEENFWSDFQRSELYRYNRPGSRAFSVPARMRVLYSSPAQVTGTTTTTDANTSRTTISPEKNSSNTHTGASKKKSLRQASRSKSLVTTQNDSGVGLGTNRDVTFTTRHDTLMSIKENAPANNFFSRENTDQLQSQSKVSKKKKNSKPSEGSSVTFKDLKNEFKRAYSAPVNYREFLKIPLYGDFDMMFGEAEPEDTGRVYVAFEEEASEERTYTDMKTLEGKHHMTYQEMKEHVLGSNLGIEEFISFLSDTVGIHLINFWLDCEYFKDSMQDFDEVENLSARNKLFRDIQDKYRLNLTRDAKDQLVKASSNVNLSHTIFIRTQYDVLRRMRAYWVPRFIVHKERMEGFRCIQEQEFLDRIRGASRLSGFFPSISLVNSMPVRPDDVLQIAKTRNWEFVSKGGRQLDDRIRSAKSRSGMKFGTPPSSPLREKLLKAMTSDKAAGGAFQKNLEQHTNKSLVSNLLFWQDVNEYSGADTATSDRLLRLNNAWFIFNKYIAQGSPNSIGMKKEDRDKVHQTLLTAKDFVSSDLYNDAKNHATEILEPAWVQYLKEDVSKYLECSISHRDMGIAPPPAAEDIQIIVDGDQIIVQRPFYKGVRTPSEKDAKQHLLRSFSLAESIDSVRRAELKKIRAEKRKIMERERRKAIRAAKKRLKEMKMKKDTPEKEGEGSTENQDGEAQGEEGEGRNDSALEDGLNMSPGGMLLSGGSRRHAASISPEQKEVKPPTFAEAAQNKALMTIFKKNLFDQQDGKDIVNMMNTYNEILAYQGISGPGAKQKKEVQAGFIYKSFLDKGSKKRFSLTDKIDHRLTVEKDRPKSPTLKDILHYIKPQLEEQFKNFWDNQAENLGLKGANLANISAAELAMKGDVDVGKGWRGRKPRAKTGGRSQPTRDDKIEFLLNLQQSAMGHPTVTMFYFYKYLTKWGEEDGFPQLDKDLFFYMEVQKFKECSHVHADEELLRRKVQSIADTFLDSATPPALQIDIPSDMQQKSLRLAQRYAAGKEVSANLFDEPQYLVFKELLPYWAGFMKVHKPPDNVTKKPMTKYQKMLKKRLDMFEQMNTPQRDFALPAIPGAGAHIAALTFTLNDGIKWKDRNADDESQLGTPIEGLQEGSTPNQGRQSIATDLSVGKVLPRHSIAPTAEVS